MTDVVKLSQETIGILKVASTINNSLKFTAGSEIKTMSASGAIVLEAEICEAFPQDFAIYELNKFLSVLNLNNFKNAAELHFDGGNQFMTIRSGSAKVKYFFSADSFVQHPGKSIKLPKVDIELKLTAEVLDNFTKAASALGHKTIKFVVADNKLKLIGSDPSSADTSNDYEEVVGETEFDGSYEATIKLDNLKLIPGDYTVQILQVPSKGIARFEHLTRKIVSFIALEIAAA